MRHTGRSLFTEWSMDIHQMKLSLSDAYVTRSHHSSNNLIKISLHLSSESRDVHSHKEQTNYFSSQNDSQITSNTIPSPATSVGER